MREVVQRHGDVEMIFQLADQLQHLQRVEAEIAQQLVVERRLNRPPADVLQDVDGLELKSIGGGASRRVGSVMRACLFGNVGQISNVP